MVYFIFPYSDLVYVNYKHENEASQVVHYILAGIYFLLLIMTVWSYLTARCSEPGYVPEYATEYDKEFLPDRERMLFEYLQSHGAFRQLQADVIRSSQEISEAMIIRSESEAPVN